MTFPATPILDDFDRPDEGPPPGANWLTPAGYDGLKVSGGQCICDQPGGGVAQWGMATGPDCEVRASVVQYSVTVWVLARVEDWISSYTGYAVELDTFDNSIYLFENVSGATLGHVNVASLSAGDKIGLRCQGSTISAWYCPVGGDWTEVINVADTTTPGGGYLFLYLDNDTGIFDDFGGGTLPGSSTGPSPTTPSFRRSLQLSINLEDPLYLSTRSFVRRMTPFINRYSQEIRAIGGYWAATLVLTDSIRKIEDWAEYGLGRHIAVYNPSLVEIWEGFINQLIVTEGPEQFSRGPLIDTGNRRKTTYSAINAGTAPPAVGSRATTAAGNNTDSQALYGIWEKIQAANQITSTEATQLRDMFLNDPTRAYPDTSLDSSLSSGGNIQVELQCLGYWHFLTGYYYINSAATGYESITTKIQNTLAAAPNAGIFSTDYSQIATNATLVKKYEAGDRTGETILKELNSLSDSSFNPYTIGFYNNRQLVYQPVTMAVEYQRRATGNRGIINQVNREIRPWDVLPARWIFRPDFLVGRHPPITAATLGQDPRAAFIETVQFEAPYSLSINGRKLSQLDQVLSRKGLGGGG